MSSKDLGGKDAVVSVRAGPTKGRKFAELVDGVKAVDNTCHGIVALDNRPDLQALISVSSLLASCLGMDSTCKVWTLGFLFLLYWNWPMIVGYEKFHSRGLLQVPRTAAQRKRYVEKTDCVKKELMQQFAKVVVNDGNQLVPRDTKKLFEAEGHFLHPCANPSERRTAECTWDKLSEDAKDGTPSLFV